MIRVLQVLDMLNINSGVTNVIMNYYRHIDKEKIQFDFLVPIGSCQKELLEEIRFLGGNVYYFSYPNIWDIRRFRHDIKCFFQIHKGIYTIVQSSFFQINGAIFKQAKKNGIPIRVAHSHSARLSNSRIRIIRNRLLCIGSLKYVTHYFSCSVEAGKSLFGKQVVGNPNHWVLKNAINCYQFKYDKICYKNIRDELGIKEELVVCHVGNFNSTKNHEFLIKIFQEIVEREDSAKLLLVGEAGDLLETIKWRVKEMGLEKNVFFLGQRNDVNRIMIAADLFIFPSKHEGFGLALLEAQCADLICLCSEHIPASATISPKCTVLSLSDSPQRWADVACKMFEGTARDGSGFVFVSDKGFDIGSASRELERIYEDAVKKIYLGAL